ncbi:MAG: MMPL family transporter [Acidobacteriota bacterium]|nr:MMPL family transporter [Acidobacteriota bacterium]
MPRGMLPQWLPRGLVRLAGNHPKIILVSALLLFLIAAGIGSRIRIEADFLKLIPEKNPTVAAFRDTIQRFGSSDTLLVAVTVGEEEDLDAYQYYADEYVDRLRESEYIDWVEYRLKDLEEAAQTLMDRFTLFLEPGDLDTLLARMNDRGAEAAAKRLSDLVRRGADMAAKRLITMDPLDVAPMLMERANLKSVDDRFNSDTGYLIDPEETFVLLVAKPTGAAADIPFARKLLNDLERIRAETDEVWLEEYETDPPEVLVAGGYPIAAAEAGLIRQDLVTGVAGSMIGVVLLFTIAFGRKRAVLISGVPLVIGLSYALAFAALALGGLNAATSAFAALLIGLAVDFIIVLYGRYLEERGKGTPHDQALDACGTHTAMGVLLGAVTTAATFYAFLISDFGGLSELGLLTGSGILVLVVVVFFLLPALLSLLERNRPASRYRLNAFGIDKLTYWGARNPRTVLTVGLAITALTAIPAFKINYDDNVMNMRSPQNPGVLAQGRIMEAFGIRFTPYMVRIDAPTEAEALVKARDMVEKLKPLADGENLARVDSVLSLLPTAESQRANIERLNTFQLDEAAFVDRFNKTLEADGLAPRAFEAGVQNVFAALRVKEPLFPTHLEDTPLGHLIERYVTVEEDGAAALVYAYGPAGKWQGQIPPALARIVEETPGAVLAGPIAVSMALKSIVKRDAMIALIAGTVVVFLMLAFELGGWRPGLLALLPLGAGVVWMLGTMSLLGLPTNYMNIFVFTMIVGIGVDYGIHLIHRLHETEDLESLAATSRTIVIASMTTVLGFGSLVMSHYPGLKSMGATAILGAIYTAVTAVTILPALAAVSKEKSPVTQTESEPVT